MTDRSHVHVTPDAHAEAVAADESAASLLAREYGGQLRDAIRLALDDTDGHEYGVSIARPAPDKPFVVGGPTRGATPGEVSVHAPMNAVHGTEGLPDELAGEVSMEPTQRFTYAELVKTHTHNVHDQPDVGLSHTDLSDAIPAGDHLTGSDTPFDVYRAQSAVVFADDPERLPVANPPTDWPTACHVFDDRPEHRPWLHLVERTPTAIEMSQSEAAELHSLSMHHDGATPAEKYRDARATLGDRVAELVVPLSP